MAKAGKSTKESDSFTDEQNAIIDNAQALRDKTAAEFGEHHWLTKDADLYLDQLDTVFSGGQV